VENAAGNLWAVGCFQAAIKDLCLFRLRYQQIDSFSRLQLVEADGNRPHFFWDWFSEVVENRRMTQLDDLVTGSITIARFIEGDVSVRSESQDGSTWRPDFSEQGIETARFRCGIRCWVDGIDPICRYLQRFKDLSS